jgi:hypothetical protein
MTFEEIRNQFFPFEPVHGVTVRSHSGNISEVIGAFLFPQDRASKLLPLREVFAKTHREQFVFYKCGEEPVGWSYEEMRDP